jgi:TolA-binding protein
MTPLPELHPDDLLDREARGELSSAERIRLDEHLAVCSVCRFERDVRADFRGDFEELASLDAEAPQIARAARGRKRVASRVRVVALVAAALLFAGAAAAEWTSLMGRRSLPSVVEAASGASETAPPTPSAKKPPSRSGVASPNTGDTASPLDSVPEPEPSSTAAPTAQPALVPQLVPQLVPPATAPPKRTTAIAPAPTACANQPESTPPPASASTLFSEAGDARQRGAYDEAVRLYGDLARTFPQSAEALNAHAILARLLLDRGDASGALLHFDAYLQSGAQSLREEALVGRALALERLGRATDEAAAWNALLEAYPQSVHAARARTRIAALGGR